LKDDRAYLLHVRDAIDDIVAFTPEGEAAFLSDKKTQNAVIRIRQRHPQASEAEVRVRLAARLYGRDAAARLFGAVPADAV
jgi:hypothetical protein